MDPRVDLSLTTAGDDPRVGDIVCRIEVLDRELVGLDAVFTLLAVIEVQDSRPVHAEHELFSKPLRLTSTPIQIRIPRRDVRAYSYSGRMIEMRLRTRLVIDDAVLFDTKIREEHELEIGIKPKVSGDAKAIVEPSDTFDFFKNLKAIPAEAQLATLLLVVAGAIVVAVNTIVGVHDQLSPEAGVWIYSHFDSDGDGSSPFLKSLIGSGSAGAAVWFLMRKQLRKYMEFSLRIMPRIRKDRAYAVSELVRGRSRVPLHDVTLRVVACNMELGQYTRGSGTDERTVSFREPVRGLVLFERRVEHVPAHVPIARHFDGVVDFAPMFSALYPPFTAAGSHGLAVHWEVQLLHPEFVDQELAGPADRFEYGDFLDA